MRLFRATPKTTKIQKTGVAKTYRKSMPKKEPTRAETSNKKNTIFDAKMAPFWSQKPSKKPPGSQERTEASSGTLKIASGALLGSLRAEKKNFGNFQKRPRGILERFHKKRGPSGRVRTRAPSHPPPRNPPIELRHLNFQLLRFAPRLPLPGAARGRKARTEHRRTFKQSSAKLPLSTEVHSEYVIGTLRRSEH